jgi:hypothetical protein
MRGIIGMLPWVIVLAIAGTAIWLLLGRQAVLGTWVLAALLIGHGLVHALYLVPPPDPPAGRNGPRWPFDPGRSWLVALAGARRGRRLVTLLVGVIVVASIAAALATVGLLPVAWWSALVVLVAVTSVVLLVLAFEPQLILGLGIDVVLLVVAVTGAWLPTAS